jgi:16S rRNA (cytosine1402-N4)-methyltransferase
MEHPPQHQPVLLAEGLTPNVMEFLQPRPGETVLDVTLGLAGHAEAFLQAVSPDGRLIAIDADAENIRAASARLAPFAGRFTVHQQNFGAIARLLPLRADIVFADLGVSSPHFDDPSRGFTFRQKGPLDLRYDRSSGLSAAELLQTVSVEDLTQVFSLYGELERSKTLARACVELFQGEEKRVWSTDDLKSTVEHVFGFRAPRVLPQVFQALRIWVNDELGALERLLRLLPDILAVGGRCGVISYHSLEDRITKQIFRTLSTPEKSERTGAVTREADFALVTRKPVSPSEEEIARNPRARSARFRVIRRERMESI